MVAPYEPGDVLPVRSLYVDPEVITLERIKKLEKEIAEISPPDHPISITDAKIARVYVNQSQYKDNLGVKAWKQGNPSPVNACSISLQPMHQRFLGGYPRDSKQPGIKQVIAVPFFLETPPQMAIPKRSL